MAAGSRRAVRGVACAAIVLACAGMAGLARTGPSEIHRPVPARGAVDSLGTGFRHPLADPLATAPDAPATRITLGPGGRDIRLSGELTEGAAERLARLLDDHDAVERIHLTSEGGLVDEGTAIGALIAERGLVTYVPDYCVSACTLAFVRGRERWVLAEARLGFHAPYETGPFGVEIAADSAPERAAYLAAGLTADFVDAALAVRPDDLMIPDAETLVRAGVATGIVAADRFPDSTLDDGADPERARAAVLRDVPLLDEIEAGAPGTVAAVAAWYLDGYRHGRSEADAFDGIRRRAADAITRSLGGAEPAVLADLGRLILRATERGHPSRGRVCAAAGDGVGAVLSRPWLGKADLAAARRIVSRGLALPLPDRARPVPEGPARPTAGTVPPLGQGRGCLGLRKAVSAALARPLPEAAQALQPLLFPAPPARSRPALEASAQPR
ncbi:hypothetical protein [Methylorubrum populi]